MSVSHGNRHSRSSFVAQHQSQLLHYIDIKCQTRRREQDTAEIDGGDCPSECLVFRLVRHQVSRYDSGRLRTGERPGCIKRHSSPVRFVREIGRVQVGRALSGKRISP